jgi:CheY-like chemotaxis protein
MSQAQTLSTSTVLLIEADPSLRRLIMLGLSHSGTRVIEASSIQALPAVDAPALDLLIVDVDQGVKSDWSQLSALREQTQLATLPIVALSWESPAEDKISLPTTLFSSLPFLSSRRGNNDIQSSRRGSALSLPIEDLTYLSKPFDARALHATIAKLLAERASQKAAQLALVEAQVLASYEQHAAPSIWPIVTAAGLLLLVTGLLFHFLITIVGVILVLISLLLWTLGTKPAPHVSSSTVSPVPAAN